MDHKSGLELTSVNIALGIIAFLFYLAAAARLGMLILASDDAPRQQAKIQAFTMGAIALILNGILLNNVIFVSEDLDLGFSNAWSLISWIIALVVLLVAIRRPVENFLVIFFPLAALGLLLILFFPSHRILAETAAMGLKIHILLSIVAYSLLTVAAFQALLLAFQEYQLSNKHPMLIMHILPPMQIMEDFLIRIIAVGFFMLSLSLATGFMFLHDIFAQHLIHKTILSLVSWLVFAVLLWGRWYLGWRGQKIIRWTIGGFCTLLLAFFGSKLVLEMILMRV
ncbi:MAG: cytochrome c biogenesis protein CcsA [Gammaproteobacteria bacterium]